MVAPWNNQPQQAWAQPMWQQPQWAPTGAAVAPTLWQQATTPPPMSQQPPPSPQPTWATPAATAPAPAWAGGQGGPSMAAMSVQAAPATAPTAPANWMGLPPASTTPAPGSAGTPDYGPQATQPWMSPAPAAANSVTTQSGTDFGGLKWGNMNPTMNRFTIATPPPDPGQSFGAYLYKVGYNPAADTYRHMFDQGGTGHGHDENNWNRIYGWANEVARANGYNDIADVPPSQWATIANAVIGRLRTDFAHDGLDFNQTGFGGAQATATSGSGGAGPGAGGTAPTSTAANGTLGNFGQLQTNDLASLLQAAANDPDRAAQILRMAQGQTGRPQGRMANFRDSLYGRAFQTALSTAGLDGFNTLQGTANDFLNRGVLGNDLIGYGGDLSRRLAGQSFDGVDSSTMEKELRAALALQGLNMGSLGGAVQQGRLDDIVYNDWARNLADRNNDTRNFADLLRGSSFQRSLANYGR